MHSYYFRFLIGCVMVMTFSCQSPAPKAPPQPASIQTDTQQKSNTPAQATVQPLSFLRTMDGKSFLGENLFSNEVIAARLRKLMGDERFAFIRDTWGVETGMTVRSDTLSAEGCMQHNCGATNFIIVADIMKDKLYAGICEEGKVNTWGEDSAKMPQILKWRTTEAD